MLHGGTTEFDGDCNRIRDGGDGPGTDTLPNRSATRSRVIWALSHIIPISFDECHKSGQNGEIPSPISSGPYPIRSFGFWSELGIISPKLKGTNIILEAERRQISLAMTARRIAFVLLALVLSDAPARAADYA